MTFSKKTLDKGFLLQILIGILVSIGIYILNDIKADIRELRDQNEVLSKTIDSMVDGAVDEIYKLKIEIERLKAKDKP